MNSLISAEFVVAPRKRKPLDATKVVPHMPNIPPVNLKEEPTVVVERKKSSTRGRKSTFSNLDDDLNTTLETSMEEQATVKRVSDSRIIYLTCYIVRGGVARKLLSRIE